MGNCHIYEEHLKDIEVIVERNPFEFPTLEISNKKKSIDSYSVDDFIIHNYNFHESIKMNMKA
jgi:thymidylate synthase